MDILIGLIAQGLARRIERGSWLGALAGALLGATAAVLVCMWFGATGAGEMMFATIVAALAGAWVGATVGGRGRAGAAAWEAEELLRPAQRVRVTNFNRALPAPLFFVIAAAASVGLIWSMMAARQADGASVVGLVSALIFLGTCGAVSVHMAYWMDIDHEVRIRKALRTLVYGPGQIQAWRVSEEAVVIRFMDNAQVDMPVRGRIAARVARRLDELAPGRGQRSAPVERT